MRKISFVFSVLLISITLSAQTRTKSFIEDAADTPREHPLDFTKLKLALSFEPATGLVKGTVTHYFTPLLPSVNFFFLDGIQMTIRQISLNGKPVKYRSDSAGITVYPSTPLVWNVQDSMTITYEASPKRGLYFTGWNDKNNLTRKQIWSQGEGIDNRCWIPMYDERNDKLISELTVTFDTAYQVLSNGSLKNKILNSDGTATWSYAMQHPHAPYLIMLGIGKYAIKETHSASGTPMHLYYYPEWKNRVEPTYQYSEAMVDFFEKEIGVNFPWESYSQIPVQDYMFGAMENTTATIFGDFYLVDKRGLQDRNYVAVNAHELAHQWFGDYVTALSDAHQWLQESFATYYNQLFERTVFGEDYFNWSRRGAENGALEESLKNKFGIAHSEGGGARVYGKGAFVLNMLKYVVGGREVYNKAIKHYLEKHAYQNVDSHDLLIAFEETTGMQLDWFWDEWVYRGGEPNYEVNFADNITEPTLVVKQVQTLTDYTGYKNGIYKMPVWISVYYTDEATNKILYWIQDQTEIINLPVPAGKTIEYVLFDEGNEVLKSIYFPKPFSFLQAQVLKAANVLDRFDALTALRSWPFEKKRDVLQKVYQKESFYALKAEVIAQLAADKNAQSREILSAGLTDTDPQVRKSALKYFDTTNLYLLPAVEKMLTDSSYEIVETALQKLSVLNPAKTDQYLAITKGIEGNLGKNVLIRWLETAYHSTGKKEYGNRLVEFCGGSYEFRTRGNAFAAVKRLAYFNESLTANLVDALFSPNNRLSNPANDLLKFFYNQDQFKPMITRYLASQTFVKWQKNILAAYGY